MSTVKPKNVQLNFKYFCHGCNLCDLDVSVTSLYYDDDSAAEYSISCKHMKKCEEWNNKAESKTELGLSYADQDALQSAT